MTTDTASEYLPTQQEKGEPIFHLQKAKDPWTEKILGARMAALCDPELTDGSRNLFTLLLDLSLDPVANMGRRFEVCISNTQLRERLARSARAIYGWTQELETQRHIWLSKKPRPNMHAMNVFHISALQPKRPSMPELPGDGMWGNGYRRPGQPMPKGARGGTCTKRHYLLDRFGNPLIAKSVDYQPPTRKECGSPPQVLREAPAQNDTCHPQVLRETPAQNDTCLPQVLRGAPAKNDTMPQQKPSVLTESLDVRSETLETPLSVQRCNAFKKGGEKDFLLHVTDVLKRYSPDFARQEMSGSGPWWRMKYRQDSGRITRILAEIERMIKEGVPFTNNPGATAVDLWKRWA